MANDIKPVVSFDDSLTIWRMKSTGFTLLAKNDKPLIGAKIK